MSHQAAMSKPAIFKNFNLKRMPQGRMFYLEIDEAIPDIPETFTYILTSGVLDDHKIDVVGYSDVRTVLENLNDMCDQCKDCKAHYFKGSNEHRSRIHRLDHIMSDYHLNAIINGWRPYLENEDYASMHEKVRNNILKTIELRNENIPEHPFVCSDF